MFFDHALFSNLKSLYNPHTNLHTRTPQKHKVMAEKAESGASCWIFWCRYSRTCCGDSFCKLHPYYILALIPRGTWHSCLRCGRWCACSMGLCRLQPMPQ